MRKCLVTGANGFVGSTLVNSLLSSGVEMHVLQRTVAESTKSNESPAKVFQIDDLANLDSAENQSVIDRALETIDVVIHTAARVHVMNDYSKNPLEEFRNTNTQGTLQLASIAAKACVKRFVFLSSIKVNGEFTRPGHSFLPNEDYVPTDPYGLSKYEAEQGLLKIAEETGMEVVIIRPPLVYGPGVKANFASMMNWVNKSIPLPFGSIHNKRSLVALDNLVDFIALCSDREKSPKAANQVFLISDGEDVSTTELLQKVAKAFNKKARLLPIPVWLMTFMAKLLGKGDVANRLFGSLQVDSSKARDLLGWQPVISMDEQLKKTTQAYLNESNNEKNF